MKSLARVLECIRQRVLVSTLYSIQFLEFSCEVKRKHNFASEYTLLGCIECSLYTLVGLAL